MSLNILVTLKASYAIVSVWLLHSRIIFLSPVVFGAPSRAVLVLTVEGPHNFHVGAVANLLSASACHNGFSFDELSSGLLKSLKFLLQHHFVRFLKKPS